MDVILPARSSTIPREVTLEQDDDDSWSVASPLPTPYTAAITSCHSEPRQRTRTYRMSRDVPSPPRFVLQVPNTGSTTTATPRHRRTPTWWLIPASHPLKILWDILTVLLSFANAYATHVAIRDRQFRDTQFARLCDLWFIIDIVLNFGTAHVVRGVPLQTYQQVWARYLTSWFVIDVLALIPGEALFLQPVIELQNRRPLWLKYILRTKAVVRVSRALQRKHVKWFGQASRVTKQTAGIGGRRLARLLIRYVPKYILFVRHMKGVIALRLLRQVHCIRKVVLRLASRPTRIFKGDDDTESLTSDDGSVGPY